jgi:hypothetical protein
LKLIWNFASVLSSVSCLPAAWNRGAYGAVLTSLVVRANSR